MPANAHLVGEPLHTLPVDDTHPYRTGAWRPNVREWDVVDCDVVGTIPDDLCGVYLRNTENPLHESIGLYHPFDGDGMLHQLRFVDGRAEYRNRFVQTDGFVAEQDAARSLWSGMLARPEDSIREDGWGARGRMKDASSTDVIVHNRRALTSFWQCGDLYALDPLTLAPLGKETWNGAFPTDVGISAHTKLDEVTGELLVFNYGKDAPYMHYGVVSPQGELVHYTPVPLPGPRLPHDMAFTEHWSILNDCPLFWDPQLLAQGVHLPTYFPDLPTRFALIPRYGNADDVRWFEADPTYVLHWINAYEDGDEVVLDGYFQHNPAPVKQPGGDKLRSIYRFIALDQLQARPHRWRFNLRTGATTEESLSDEICEFGMINGSVGGRRHRYSYAMTARTGWFLFNGIRKYDHDTGTTERYDFPDGVYASETPMAPRVGATSEDDGYLLTFTTDVNADRSECLVFAAQDLAGGPIARMQLPERISSGTHSCWAPDSMLG